MMSQDKSFEEIKKDYEEYLNLFEHPAWIKFIETQKETYENEQKNAHNLFPTGDEWQQFRGHARLMDRILGFEDLVRDTLKHIDEAIEQRDEGESDFDM